MKECFGTAEPSPLTLISAGTASAFLCGKVFKSGLASQPPSVLHWLVIHSGVGWEERKTSLAAEVQTFQVGLHRPTVLSRQLLTELIILHIHKLKK